MAVATRSTGTVSLARGRWSEILMVALFCVLWSSAFAPAKIALRDCPPFMLLAVRFVIAGLICLWLARRAGEARAPSWRQVAALGVLGLFNNAIYLGFSWTAMTTVSSGFAAVLISANPLLTGVVAVPVLGEGLTSRKILGLVLGLAGVAVVLRSRIGGGVEDPTGTLLLVGGLVALVSGTVLYKKLAPAVGAWTGNGIQLLVAGLFLLPVALGFEELDGIRFTVPMLASMAWMVLGVSVGGYFLWFAILSRRSATAASSLHFLMPPLGLAFGWIILGESVPPVDLLGIVPIAAGIALVTRAPRP